MGAYLGFRATLKGRLTYLAAPPPRGEDFISIPQVSKSSKKLALAAVLKTICNPVENTFVRSSTLSSKSHQQAFFGTRRADVGFPSQFLG